MNYCFDYTITKEDYYKFNKFNSLKSPYGKKVVLFLRIFFSVFLLVNLLLSILPINGDSEEVLTQILGIITLYIILNVIFNLFIKPFFILLIKLYVRFLNNKKKKCFSENNKLGFFDDKFIETTEFAKTELNYNAIDNISVIPENVIYIHLNRMIAIIIPFNAFESKKQFDEFVEFLKTKSENLKIYN